MAYEVDVLGVGTESQSGDAIAVRFWDPLVPPGDWRVVIIDGGFQDTGAELVAHVGKHYGTNKVDLVISTHPDQDHINGLETVLEELEVVELWIHQPWNHCQGLAGEFQDGRITDKSIGDRLCASLEAAHRLVRLAERKGVRVREPFTGLSFAGGAVKVLGPSETYYEELIPSFDRMPAVSNKAAATGVDGLGGLLGKAVAAVKKIYRVVWGQDEIADDGVTSAKNSSSVITQFIVDGRRLLFTADAGIDALHRAANELDNCIDPAELKFIQIPHHGSRRNVGPAVLDRIIEKPVAEGARRDITAIASTAKEGEPKHPRAAVINAFIHRGVTTLATRGSGICLSHETPGRPGWNPVSPESYRYEYEDEG
jgi:beta-lactamase superfamily II metal-dependent hydrolase